jgi:hypothetical protein
MPENEAMVVQPEEQTLPVGFKDPLVYQAKLIAKSDVLPKGLQGRPANVYLALMAARDIPGLTEFTATQKLYVIDGKFAMYAELQRALVMAHEQCEYLVLVSNDGQEAIWNTKRKGYPRPVEWRYNLEDAKQAGLLSKDNWRKHTKDMLNARASAALCRLVYPDLLMGLSYSIEELRDGVVPIEAEITDHEIGPKSQEDQLAEAIAKKAAAEKKAQELLPQKATEKKKPRKKKAKPKDSAEAAKAVKTKEEFDKEQEAYAEAAKAAEGPEEEKEDLPPHEPEKDAPEPTEEQGEGPEGPSASFLGHDDIQKLVAVAKKNGYAEAALRRYCMHLADGLDLEDAPLHLYHKLFKWAAEPKEKE